MDSSHSHDHREDVIAYLEQIVFPEKYLFQEKQVNLKNPCMKIDRQLNLEKKEKISDRGVTIKNLPKTSIPRPTELLCLPPN